MPGTGPISVRGVTTYGYFTEQNARVRLRLSLDDWERLGLCEGERVVLGLPGRDRAELLITAADAEPPVVWLDLLPVFPPRQSRVM